MKLHVLRILALLAVAACISLVGTIEFLNAEAGDAIGKKQTQEPRSKWRTGSLSLERKTAESRLRAEWDIAPNHPFTPEQSSQVESLARARWDTTLPYERLARAMRNYSPWSFPLGVVATVLGAFAWAGKNRLLRTGCCGVGIATVLAAALRYIPSLGW